LTLHLGHISSKKSSDGDGFGLAYTGGSPSIFFAGFEGTDESGDASYLTEADARLVKFPALLSLSEGWDGDCGAGAGGVGCTSGVGILGTLLALFGRGVGSGRTLFFAFPKILSRRSRMDLSRINSIAAVRCEFKPDEELRMILEIKIPSTEDFSLDWKSSCSISLTRLWLCGGHVSAMGCQESWNELLRSEGREQLMYDVVLI